MPCCCGRCPILRRTGLLRSTEFLPSTSLSKTARLFISWAMWADNTHSFDFLAPYRRRRLEFCRQSGTEPERVAAAEVTRNFFSTFGLRADSGTHISYSGRSAGTRGRRVDQRHTLQPIGRAAGRDWQNLFDEWQTCEVVWRDACTDLNFREKTPLASDGVEYETNILILKQAFFNFTVGRLKACVASACARGSDIAIQVRRSVEELRDRCRARFFPAWGMSHSICTISLRIVKAGTVALARSGWICSANRVRGCCKSASCSCRTAPTRNRVTRRPRSQSPPADSSRPNRKRFTFFRWRSRRTSCCVRRHFGLAAFHSGRDVFVRSITVDVQVLLFLMGVSFLSGLIFGLFPGVARATNRFERTAEGIRGQRSDASFVFWAVRGTGWPSRKLPWRSCYLAGRAPDEKFLAPHECGHGLSS